MTQGNDPRPFSRQALLRYGVVSLVRARLLAGEGRRCAVEHVAAMEHMAADGVLCRVSTRSIYRWLARHEAGGMSALADSARPSDAASRVLDPKLLAFLAAERGRDRLASIPELLRRAKERGLMARTAAVDRRRVYRALVRMQVPTGRTKQERQRDMRRFAYAHRMELVLADGKHFRAGPGRLRRVAIFFLDDATRRALHVVVGSSESAELFLRGLYEVLCAHGRMGILYLDHGSGFIAGPVAEVCRRLEMALIHGERRYPEGHGKIERFNQTALHALLRTLDGRADVDASFGALELRLRHWMFQHYNHQPHEGLARIDGRYEAPHERWTKDSKALRHVPSADIRASFVIYHKRTVSRDRLVSIDSVRYELPLSLAPGGRRGPRLQIEERVLDKTFHVLCPDGALIRIHPVDLLANAHAPRARREPATDSEPDTRTAADLAFERDLGSVLDADLGVDSDDTDDTDGPDEAAPIRS
jgi:transposase InsO family protein